MCGWMHCLCLCSMCSCYLDSCIPVIWAQARTFWQRNRSNMEGGEDEINIKKKERKRKNERILASYDSFQGLFLSPLRSRSHKQADCDVISCLFFPFFCSSLSSSSPPFCCLSNIKILFFLNYDRCHPRD